MKEELDKKVESAIKILCEDIDESGMEHKLLGIGFIATDDMQTIGAMLLFDGDLADDAKDYQKIFPVEWKTSEEDLSDRKVFDQLELFLKSQKKLGEETESEYKEWVSTIFTSFITNLNKLNLREKYDESLYLTFSGVDPNNVLESEEKKFVKAMNTKVVFEQWCSC